MPVPTSPPSTAGQYPETEPGSNPQQYGRTLWRNVLLISMSNAHRSTPFRSDFLVSGSRIEAIGPDLEPPAGTTILDGSGLLIVPGLVNAHMHSWESLLRGTSEKLPLELWTLETYPPVAMNPVPDRLIELRTLVAGIDALRGGTTALLDDVGELPSQSRANLESVFSAYDRIGIRATCTGGVANVAGVDRLPFADALIPAELLDASRKAQEPASVTVREFESFSRDAFARHHGTGGGRLRYAVAPSAPQRSTDGLIRMASDLAREHDAVLHMHLVETRLQAVLAAQRYGTTIVEHLDSLGVLGGHTTLAHAVWLTTADIGILGTSSAVVAHNPLSNRKLGSGVLPWRDLHDAGATIGLGTDGTASNDSLRMLDVIKATALEHTITTPEYSRWPSADEVLWAATRGGAAAVGQPSLIGSLEVGKAADFVVLDLTASTNFTPLNDAARQLVFSENGESIVQVWVAGECVVDHGQLTRIDQDAVLTEFRETAADYLESFERTRIVNRRLAPVIASVYDRAWQEPVGSENGQSSFRSATGVDVQPAPIQGE
jgi:5-methylthioadenosine/S-adenosylhomocysteine deaminase